MNKDYALEKRTKVLNKVKIDGNKLSFYNNYNDDYDIVIEAVKQNGLALQYASDRLKDDKTIVSNAVNQNGLALEFASDKLKNNKTIVSNAIKQNGNAINFADDNLKQDKKLFISALKNCAIINYKFKDTIDDRDTIIEVVKINPLNVQYMSLSFVKDKDIVLEAVRQNGLTIGYLPQPDDFLKPLFVLIDPRSDKEIVLEAVKQNGLALQYASDRLKDDEEIVSIAVDNDPYALQYASNRLKDTKRIVLLALHKDIYTLECASNRIRSNLAFIEQYFKRDEEGYLITCLSSDIKRNKELMIEIIKNHSYNKEIFETDPDLKQYVDDIDFVTALIPEGSFDPRGMSERLWDDEKIVLLCAENENKYIDLYCYDYMSDRLKSNILFQFICANKSGNYISCFDLLLNNNIEPNIPLYLIDNYGLLKKYFLLLIENELKTNYIDYDPFIGEEEFDDFDDEDDNNQIIEEDKYINHPYLDSHGLIKDYNLMYDLVSTNGLAIKYAAENLQNNYDILLCAIEQSPHLIYKILDSGLYDIRRIVINAVKQDGLALELTREYRGDREVVLAAVKQNGDALQFADEFRNDKEIIMEAVKQNGISIRYTNYIDADIIKTACNQNPAAIQYISYDVLKRYIDKDINALLNLDN